MWEDIWCFDFLFYIHNRFVWCLESNEITSRNLWVSVYLISSFFNEHKVTIPTSMIQSQAFFWAEKCDVSAIHLIFRDVTSSSDLKCAVDNILRESVCPWLTSNITLPAPVSLISELRLAKQCGWTYEDCIPYPVPGRFCTERREI